MTKRKRDNEPGASRVQTTISGGLGKSKRIKVQQSSGIAEKENRPLREPKSKFKAPVKFPAWGANLPKKNVAAKRNVPSKPSNTRSVLAPKNLNALTELKKHPISEHVLKPGLYNDEGWIGQQQVLMTSILNDVLDTHACQNKAWKEEDLENARMLAFQYYQSDEFQSIVRRLSSSFRTRKLMLSTDDEQCFRDLGLRAAVKELLCESYHLSWLALGLELVTGRRYGSFLEGNKHNIYAFIDNFILDQIDLQDMTDDASRDQLSMLKLISLVYILDHLKTRLPGPCLFRTKSKYSSSHDVLQNLSKVCLAGQGNISRRLQSITKSDVSHTQYPLDDFNYRITNLAVDMRDGVRLTKLVEILSERGDCSQQLRWPATSLSHRIHNISIALTTIQTEGIDLTENGGTNITAEDIESGVREKTLFVLWQVISRWKLPRYLKNIDLRDEIRTLRKILSLRKQKLPSVQVLEYSDNKSIDDLLEWVALVCSLCNKPLSNFTTSFVNNEPFDCILEFYYPRKDEAFLERHKKLLPSIFGNSHSRNTRELLDMRVIIMALALLASRALSSNDRIEAAIIIQRHFRSYASRDDNTGLNRKHAAIRIQRAFRRFLRRKVESLVNTTIAIQALARGYLFRTKWRRRALRSALLGQEQVFRVTKLGEVARE